MKKLICSLMLTAVFGITGLCACEHTWDDSDCWECKSKKEKNKTLECVGQSAFVGAVGGALTTGNPIIGGVGGAVGGYLDVKSDGKCDGEINWTSNDSYTSWE
ncbi:MAG: hypothetical protein ILP07_09315 [Treponema sp.]|nr:hypothetical protein [Treponema sp.]